MISTTVLVGYALLISTIGSRMLCRARWPRRAPHLGIAAWLALETSLLLCVALVGLALSVGLTHVSMDLASLVDACVTSFRHAYRTPAGTAGSLVGLTLLASSGARLLWSGLRHFRRNRAVRRHKTWTADLLGRTDLVPGVVVVPHDDPFAFCIPGHHRRVVLTSATLDLLDRRQVDAVLAHERAHLRGRHHLVVGLARTILAAFPFVPAFRRAAEEIAVLVEIIADDAARRAHGAGSLGQALGMLSRRPAGSATLSASSSGVQTRIDRLSRPLAPLRRTARAAGWTAIGLVAALPLSAVVWPVMWAATQGLCLIV